MSTRVHIYTSVSKLLRRLAVYCISDWCDDHRADIFEIAAGWTDGGTFPSTSPGCGRGPCDTVTYMYIPRWVVASLSDTLTDRSALLVSVYFYYTSVLLLLPEILDSFLYDLCYSYCLKYSFSDSLLPLLLLPLLPLFLLLLLHPVCRSMQQGLSLPCGLFQPQRTRQYNMKCPESECHNLPRSKDVCYYTSHKKLRAT